MCITGYCNIHGNEEADQLAKNTASSTETSNYNLIIFSDIKKMYSINHI
jgi:hypothetical protein